MPISYGVRLPQFEGPLEVLLDLIAAKKLEIDQIALAEVTDQYLASIADMEAVGLQELAGFLVVASTLLLIKSRSLIPQFRLTEEEEKEIMSLEERLKEYQRYREAAKTIRAVIAGNHFIFSRHLWQGFSGGFFPPANAATPAEFAERLKRIVEELSVYLKPHDVKIVAKIVSVEEKVKEILSRMQKASRASFEEVAGKRSKSEVILSFLALLFLFKIKAIMLSQGERFGSIEIQKT